MKGITSPPSETNNLQCFFRSDQPAHTEDIVYSFISLNVDNAHTNHVYMSNLAHQSSLLIIQEHWLFSFESHELFFLLSNHKGITTSVDIDDPLPPLQRPEDMVALLSSGPQTLTPNKDAPRHSPWIVAVSIKQFANCDICLIGAYLPCHGTEMSSFLRSHTENLNKEFAAIAIFYPTFLPPSWSSNTYCILWNVNYGLSPNITSLPTLH